MDRRAVPVRPGLLCGLESVYQSSSLASSLSDRDLSWNQALQLAEVRDVSLFDYRYKNNVTNASHQGHQHFLFLTKRETTERVSRASQYMVPMAGICSPCANGEKTFNSVNGGKTYAGVKGGKIFIAVNGGKTFAAVNGGKTFTGVNGLGKPRLWSAEFF